MAPLPEALLASSWSSMAASSVSWNRVPRITESSEWQSERSREVDVEEDCPSARENSDTCETKPGLFIHLILIAFPCLSCLSSGASASERARVYAECRLRSIHDMIMRQSKLKVPCDMRTNRE